MLIEGVFGLVIDHEEGTVCWVHKFIVASVWPFELLQVELDPINLGVGEGGVVGMGVGGVV